MFSVGSVGSFSSMCDVKVTNILNEILRVDGIEEAFGCFLVHRSENEAERLNTFQQELFKTFKAAPADQHEQALKQYLIITATRSNHSRMKVLLDLLESLVDQGALSARVVCESIMSSEKLVYKNAQFWCGCFGLMHKIIGGVEYKGVREIMKGCSEKAKSLPEQLYASEQPQMQALLSLAEYIMDRNACLLPGYLLVNEIQKAYPDAHSYPHWKFARLFCSYVESFRPCAQMVSIVCHSTMRPVVEHSGCPDHLVNPWKLDPSSLRFTLKGVLPYDPDLTDRQTGLLRYVLEQPYSRDMVCGMLGLQKQHKQYCAALEEQLVELVIMAMERSETELPQEEPDPNGGNGDDNTPWMWLHLSSQLIYFVLFQFASFPNLVMALHSRLASRELRRGRDHLMWVLLQFISGSIQRNPLSNFLPVLKLYELLYPEREPPLPVPDFNRAHCTHQMAMCCIWIHLLKKAQSEQAGLQWPVPHKLKAHHEFLQHLASPTSGSQLIMGVGGDYRIALLCNAYSTNQEYFSRPMAALVDTIQKTNPSGTGGANAAPPPPVNTNNSNNDPTTMVGGPTTPLSMAVLDSLTVHSKMSLIHSIVTHVIKLAQSKSSTALTPALVETYSRLLVYTEIESLGIKGFISQLLPTVFKSHAWGTLYTLLEMFSYRMHHIQPHYRVQLLSHLHSLAAVPQTNQTQLHLCVESTALRLITGLGSGEVQPQLSRFLSEPKTLVSSESEELNRALVLTLARSMHITGTGNEGPPGGWCHELLATVMQSTPCTWAVHTLECFPRVLRDFFTQHAAPVESKQQLKKAVEEEYRNWASMNNENDIIAHFSVAGTPPLFLCLLWKMLLETDRISPIAYKILERIGARALSAHLRKFCDCLVFEFTNCNMTHPNGGQHVNKCVDTINAMIWKYNIVTIDRLVLCLALRTQEGNEAQVCFFIIQLLLLKAAEFRNRVQEFVKENSPEHWKQSNWHEKHLSFHRKYPEKFGPESDRQDQQGGAAGGPGHQSLPVYFGNVCLRFLPVFDIVIHRFLEIKQVGKSLEILLEHLGCLYKFHDRPVTYLYNTLHYYEGKLRDRPPLKRRLVSAILGSLKEIRAPNWALSEPYQLYMTRTNEDNSIWMPDMDYYLRLVKRVVETMAGNNQFPTVDWRFNEFPNAGAHALYVTCVELMALPVGPSCVGTALLDVITRGYVVIPHSQMQVWINSIGLIMAALPESYWSILHDRLMDVVGSLTEWPYKCTPFELFNFHTTHDGLLENKYSYMLALAHSMWHHAGLGQIAAVPRFIKERLSTIVKTEPQLLYLCHLVGPFLPRFNVAIVELTSTLYEMLVQVDRNQEQLIYMDPICDLLYHIKYMFVGDMMKPELETIIKRLRPALRMRLRFIAHLNIDESNNAV